MWVNLFARNRMASDSLALSYIPPTIVDGSVVIQLDPTETAKEPDKWKHSLIVAVIGEIPGYNHIILACQGILHCKIQRGRRFGGSSIWRTLHD